VCVCWNVETELAVLSSVETRRDDTVKLISAAQPSTPLDISHGRHRRRDSLSPHVMGSQSTPRIATSPDSRSSATTRRSPPSDAKGPKQPWGTTRTAAVLANRQPTSAGEHMAAARREAQGTGQVGIPVGGLACSTRPRNAGRENRHFAAGAGNGSAAGTGHPVLTRSSRDTEPALSLESAWFHKWAWMRRRPKLPLAPEQRGRLALSAQNDNRDENTDSCAASKHDVTEEAQ
jgi:hypothetical protein